MLWLRTVPAALVALLLSLLVASTASAVSCTGSQPALCPLGEVSGNDCQISADCTIESSAPTWALLEFGDRRLVIKSGTKVTVLGDGILDISAAAVLLETSAKILAPGAGFGQQRVIVETDGDVTLQTGSAIDVSSAAGTLQAVGVGGSITLLAATATIAGNLRASGAGRDTYGGTIDVVTTGSLSVAGLDVSGGDRAGGGDITLLSNATVTASGAIKAEGLDGGTVEMDGDADVVTTSDATIEVQATGPDGSGGSVAVSTGGSAMIAGDISGTGREDIPFDGEPAQTGGDGADFDADSLNGSVTITADIDISGAPSGTGGDFVVTADQDVTIAGKVLLRAVGVWGFASDFVFVLAGRDTTISGQLDGTSAGTGGSLDVEAERKVLITSTGELLANGASTFDVGMGGQVFIQGCSVEIADNAVLSALGAGVFPDASNFVRASTGLTIAGDLQAGAANRLDYRSTPPVILPTAKFLPAGPGGQCPDPFTTPAVGTCRVQDPTMPCCGVDCPVTTTTTRPPTTTTTLPPTTTTTVFPTTTTLPPPTTSSTTSTTATSSTSTTSTTTTTEAPPSTVISAPSTTTSTTAPPPGSECVEMPSGVDAASCHLDALADTVGTSSLEALGGKASARRLKAFLDRTTRFLDLAAGGANVKVNLRKARVQLKAFERAVQRGIKRKRGAIDRDLGEFILGLAQDATNDVGVAQTTLR
jgi:hypothetical protein